MSEPEPTAAVVDPFLPDDERPTGSRLAWLVGAAPFGDMWALMQFAHDVAREPPVGGTHQRVPSRTTSEGS